MQEEILAFINTVLHEEGVSCAKPETTLKETRLDSFGYIILWMAIEERYGSVFSLYDISALNYETTTMAMLCETIAHAKINHA